MNIFEWIPLRCEDGRRVDYTTFDLDCPLVLGGNFFWELMYFGGWKGSRNEEEGEKRSILALGKFWGLGNIIKRWSKKLTCQ